MTSLAFHNTMFLFSPLALLVTKTLLAAEPIAEKKNLYTVRHHSFSARRLPPRSIPNGWTPYIDILSFEVRLEDPSFFKLAPDRIDLHVCWLHSYLTQIATMQPRYPFTLYATYLKPLDTQRQLSYGSGIYTELGRDHFVIDNQLKKRTAALLGITGRIGREKEHPTYWRKGVYQTGVYLNGIVGLNVGRDPNQLYLSSYFRIGIQTTSGRLKHKSVSK